MSTSTIENAMWSLRHFVQANINNVIAPVLYSPPQNDPAYNAWILVTFLQGYSVQLSQQFSVRMSVISRADSPGIGALGLAGKVVDVFSAPGQNHSFDLYDHATNVVIGTVFTVDKSLGAEHQFQDGVTLVPVDLFFKFRSTYTPKV